MGTPGVQPKSMQVYAQSMRQQMQSAMDSNASKGMPNPAGIPQGSPAIDANEDFYNAGQLRGMAAGAPGGSTSNGNHALQDYQMQLMLLEQQNKRRLLMARQEQDGVTSGAGAPMPGQAGFPQGMSPRAGPSPTPDDQMKGTPKMAPGGIPQPNPDGSMSQGKQVDFFEWENQTSDHLPAMYAQMKMNGGMMGPNGPMMPATSHPAYNQMNGQINAQQQMEMMRAQNGNRPPNGGPWAPGPPGPQMMPGGGNEQPPNMTPQQRTNMPPPPAPATGDTTRTQPPSPQPSSAAPPTPSQTGKPNAKGKKDAKGNNKVCSLIFTFVSIAMLTFPSRRPPQRKATQQLPHLLQRRNRHPHRLQHRPSHLLHRRHRSTIAITTLLTRTALGRVSMVSRMLGTRVT